MHPETLDWSAPEYTHHPRSVDWFWGLGVVIIVSAAFALYFGDALFSIVLILAGGTLAFLAIRPPHDIHYSLTPKGIRAGDTFYPYASLKSYWVTDHLESEKIILISKRRFLPHIIIPVTEYHPGEIRLFLEEYLPAVEHQEPWVYLLADRLRF